MTDRGLYKTVTVEVDAYTRDVPLKPDEYTCQNCGCTVHYDRYPGSIKPSYCERPACQEARADSLRRANAERVRRYRERLKGNDATLKVSGNPALAKPGTAETPSAKPQPVIPQTISAATLEQLTAMFRAAHGRDWLLAGATIARHGRDVQFVAADGSTIAQAKSKDAARRWLADYLANGKPNFAMLRH